MTSRENYNIDCLKNFTALMTIRRYSFMLPNLPVGGAAIISRANTVREAICRWIRGYNDDCRWVGETTV